MARQWAGRYRVARDVVWRDGALSEADASIRSEQAFG
jgi:hypothetical protein